MIDAVLERGADRVVAVKRVSRAEEYLADHFPSYPVLPGVLMLETMVQAARLLVPRRAGAAFAVLGGVRAFRYARFVPPGWSLVVAVERDGAGADFRGTGYAVESDTSAWADAPVASSGRFSLRPLTGNAPGAVPG